MSGIDAIAAERARQIAEEGWTPEHDDAYLLGELADAAACFAICAGVADDALNLSVEQIDNLSFREGAVVRHYWPWHRKWWKPKTRRADLVRAGALIAAEIDRLDRLAASEGDL
ncbi:MAG: hypothetical protein R3D80_14335 [Paracoccaceae bacterium]